MNSLIWFVVGLLAAVPLLLYAQRISQRATVKLLGWALVIAALVYVGFAMYEGDVFWLEIEGLGVIAYSLFYWQAVQRPPHALLWLAAGWLLHPLWDVGLHLAGPARHVVPDWYAVACLAFDLAVGVYCLNRARTASVADQP